MFIRRVIETTGAIASICSFLHLRDDPWLQPIIWILGGCGFFLVAGLSGGMKSWLWRKRDRRVDSLSDEAIIAAEGGRQYVFYYPLPFKRPPYLVVYCINGEVNIEVVDQREDGFAVRIYEGYAERSVKVRWIAKGEFR